MRSLWLPLLMALLWCTGAMWMYVSSAEEKDQGARDLALIQARSHTDHLKSVRAWNAAHGGIYVHAGEYGMPNPWLPEDMREIRTEQGNRLIRMNPAYMSRQIAERLSLDTGVGLRITGLNNLRPGNRADTWERAALESCARGASEVFALTEGTRQEYRLLTPLPAEEACLQCHTSGRKGDILGGISVRLDATPFLENAAAQKKSLLWAYLMTALAGAAAVGGITFNLNRRRMLAEETGRAKSAFLANMSHDMRTPLNGMLGMNELLECAHDAPTKEKARRFMRTATQALLEMVTDITDHAAIDSGQVCLATHDFLLQPALEACLALYQPTARDKGITLALEMEPSLPISLHGDAFRLRQAVGNLISNAVKFTAAGAVFVRVSGEMEARQDVFILCVEVQDSGPGIAVEEQERIFESFERGAAARRGPLGTGLGLSIARNLARLMGGDVTVYCPAAGGSLFTLRVRLGVVATENYHDYTQQPCTTNNTLNKSADSAHAADACRVKQVQKENTEGHSPGEQATLVQQEAEIPLRVLVVEDNAINAFFVAECLRRSGATVRVEQDGGGALTALQEASWDVALLDLRMPVLDGATVLEYIRSGKTATPRTLPVIILTATCGEDDQRRLQDAGCSGILEKPVSSAQLRAALRQVCHDALTKVQNADSIAVSYVAASEAQEHICTDATLIKRHDGCHIVRPDMTLDMAEAEIFDYNAALLAMDNDTTLLEKMLSAFREEIPQRLDAVRAACAVGDWTACAQAAHAMKNSAGSLHMPRLHAVAARLEREGTAASAPALYAETEKVMTILRQRRA